MDPASDGMPRSYIIKRSQHLGYGFIAGGDSPTMVKNIEPNGPSYKKLLPGDIIMAVNGISVTNASREEIIKMIQLNKDQIEITVRQQSYEEMIRARNLADPKFYTLNKSNNNPSPMNRLVTSVSQQQQQHQQQSHHQHQNNSGVHSPYSFSSKNDPQPVQTNKFNTVLRQKQPTNGIDLDQRHNLTHTLGRNGKNYGRHSPLPQRCKSVMDIAKNGRSNKNSSDVDNDQPMLKRSNTMRLPKEPPAQVKEILKVVIKIFFEDGHYRVLNYNQNTTVGTILETLSSRIAGNSIHSDQIKRYFGLALTVGDNSDGHQSKEQLPKPKLLHILDENDSIMKIRQLPYAVRLRLLYRMVYPPADVNKLYIQDKIAFEYLYQQSFNDLKLDRFCPELDHDSAFKLSALSLLEYVHSNHSKSHGNSRDPKVYIKLIKKTPGIEYFLPSSIVDMFDKKGKRIPGHHKKLKQKLTDQIKKNFEEFDFEPPKVKSTTNLNCYSTTSFHELSLPEMQSSPSDYIKLLFLNYLSQLPCYGNSKRPIRTSTSPIERSSAEGCSSSLESVPRTSDSSPLIRQDRNISSQSTSLKVDSLTNNNISRLAQMNSIRSLSSVQSSNISQPVDQPDLAQTPSIESISSITLNTQNSPSPQQAPIYLSQTSENYPMALSTSTMNLEPSPMPRQQINMSKAQDYLSIDKVYNQRYKAIHTPIEELLKSVMLLPPPPPSSLIYGDHLQHPSTDYRQASYLTPVLTDKDLEKLRVPPPPRMIN